MTSPRNHDWDPCDRAASGGFIHSDVDPRPCVEYNIMLVVGLGAQREGAAWEGRLHAHNFISCCAKRLV
jgi:hypothetical protein